MRGGVVSGVISCLLVLMTAACGTVSPSAAVLAGATAEPSPSGVALGQAALRDSSTVAGTCPSLAGTQPTGAVPSPGHMPAGSTMAAIYRRGYLRVGVDQTTLFFGYREPSGNLDGFDIEVARQVAKAIFGNPNDIRYVVVTDAQRIHESSTASWTWSPTA